MAWIKIRNDIEDDPAVISIAAQTNLETDHVVGKLRRIWAWADEQTYDGNGGGVTEAWIDARVGVTGFARAMVAVTWLIVSPGGIIIPNFERHNGQTAKERAVTAKRVGKFRTPKSPKSNGDRNGATVTLRAPEKIREEKNIGGKPPITPGRGEEFDACILPPNLERPDFREAWHEWQAYRREIKKPLKTMSLSQQLRDFAALGPDKSIAQIRQSIRNGWQGLFEHKENLNGTTRGHAKQDADQRRAAQRAQQYDEHLELPPNLLARPIDTP